MLYMEKYKNKICIVISSCDKYLRLADVQLHFFKKYWPNCPLDIFYITETKPIPNIDSNLKIINFITHIDPVGPSDWGKNLKMLFDSTKYDYILYTQDDYIFTDFVDEGKLSQLFKYVIENDVNYLRFYGSTGMCTHKLITISDDVKIREIPKDCLFRASLMIAIWNKNTFNNLIHTNYGITPWKFELNNIDREYDKFYCVDLKREDDSDVIKFTGIYGSGDNLQIYPHVKQMIKNENIKTSTGENFDVDLKL